MTLGLYSKSEFFESGSSMAPNSEESSRIGQFSLIEDALNKEKQRPPIYNPEDYAISLKKWGRKNANGAMVTLYTNASTSDLECRSSQSNSFRDYRNPMLTSLGSEMTLRQFGTVTELLAKLKSDLRLAYPSFVQEFVGDHLDGVTLLLDLLRAIQLSQSNNGHQTTGSSNTTGKVPPSVQRRALLDELSCLQCLLSCCTRYSEAVRKLTASSASLFTLAICIMSNVNKSRIIALQLLTKACEMSSNGHTAVSEAMSTLRLRFGEPMRFRFLIGMLTSAGGQTELLAAGMKFLNTFLDTSASQQKRLYIQAELDQAGFDIVTIKKNIGNNSSCPDMVFEEIDHWDKNHIDIETISIRLEDAERENDSLRDKVLLLERKVQILQEEKGILISLEQCLKERCSDLQGEVKSLKSDKSMKGTLHFTDKKDISPTADDEGISSSERSPSPEQDILVPPPEVYNMYTNKNDTNNKSDEDEETTIDEVIEELKNIINDAETEQYVKEERTKQLERKRIEEAQVKSKLGIRIDIDDFALDNETEIIPTNIYPQPPRKARSLVHLFHPAEDYDYCNNKELFFENETAFTSEEGSDSLLSASRCQLPKLERDSTQNHRVVVDTREKPKVQERRSRTCSKNSIKRSESFRHVEKTNALVHANVKQQSSFDGSYYYNTPVMMYHKKQKIVADLQAARLKSKSLDRIDDGLDSMVDIVVTDHKLGKTVNRFHTKSDSGNVSGTSLSRSISNVFSSNNRKSKLSCHSDDKQKMFLPVQRDHDVPYYFPRIHEKKTSTSSSFLIKRGHTNAGLYSGQIHHQQSLTKHDYNINISGSNKSHGKLTDLPSGLY
ncbi:unnamed protein product [Brassicogethes aeneus]|uniref:GBD/FH3 domain-containing protein n=1 Tax=Brassicogethes aeneus TaxID=1431903 RepID=A0A9P0FRB1_BRAAE|nr:unnamed protein product [Brassicogethes aeneus]